MAKQKEDQLGNEEIANGFDAQAMITENAEKRTVVRYNDRVKLVITQTTRHYNEGDKIAPHRVMAEALIKQGIAKEVK